MFYFFTSFDVFCFTFDVFAFDVFVHLMLKTSNAHVLSKSCQGDWSLTQPAILGFPFSSLSPYYPLLGACFTTS